MGGSPQPMAMPMNQTPAMPPQHQMSVNPMERDQGFMQPQQQQQVLPVQSQPQPFNAAPGHENIAQLPPTTNMFKMQKGKSEKQ